MSDAKVTIIIATYNRPEVLEMAIYSVIQQTFNEWSLLVIGDQCDDRTRHVVEKYDDKRINYINLSERFGEQSGPNSIGIALAKTKYIAFLNHDDIWLPDHLKIGIDTLENQDYNFFIGGTANSAFIEKVNNELVIHVDQINTNERKPSDFFKQKVLSYEPASSWIFNKEITNKIGDWHYYDELYRVPIEDFILRAWRSGAKFHFSNKVTVWYILTHYQKQNDKLSYEYQSEEHQYIYKLLLSKSANDIRTLIHTKYTEWQAMDVSSKEALINKTSFGRKNSKSFNKRDKFYLFRKRLSKTLISNSIAAFLYKHTGLDLITIASRFKQVKKGEAIQKAILKRTGEMPSKPNKEDLIRNIKKEFFSNPQA
jgi:glycosyltransferase involved in cell wall biosynthesis